MEFTEKVSHLGIKHVIYELQDTLDSIFLKRRVVDPKIKYHRWFFLSSLVLCVKTYLLPRPTTKKYLARAFTHIYNLDFDLATFSVLVSLSLSFSPTKTKKSINTPEKTSVYTHTHIVTYSLRLLFVSSSLSLSLFWLSLECAPYTRGSG